MAKQDKRKLPKRDDEIAQQVGIITKAYLFAAGINYGSMATRINAYMPPDTQFTLAAVALWATGKRVPRPVYLDSIIEKGGTDTIVTLWAKPIRDLQLEAFTSKTAQSEKVAPYAQPGLTEN